MRTPARFAATVIALAALLGACSSSSSPKSSNTTTTTPAAALEARIVSKAPAGFVRQADDVGDTGPSDLAKAIRDEESADGGKDLRSEGFLRGYQRLWIGPAHAQIIVFVNQFESQAGARRNFARTTEYFDAKPPRGTFKFAVPFLPADQAVAAAGADETDSAAFIQFTSGVFSVQIVCNGPTLSGLQARALEVAERQYRRL